MELIIHAPALQPNAHVPSEAELLGSIAWLWMNSPKHRHLPLDALQTLLLPPLRLRQYILVIEELPNGSRPVAYLGWANLSEAAESRYVADPYNGLQPSDWNSGDRMWLTDYFIPFGNVRPIHKRLEAWMSKASFRYLYHRGQEQGVKVRTFAGAHVDKAYAALWWRDRPMLALSK